MSRIALIACSSKKLEHPAAALDLCQGSLFTKSRAYAERLGVDGIHILSAKYGLVPADTVIDGRVFVSSGLARDGERVKVLSRGEVSVPLKISASVFSRSARQKIEAAGGEAIVPPPAPEAAAVKRAHRKNRT